MKISRFYPFAIFLLLLLTASCSGDDTMTDDEDDNGDPPVTLNWAFESSWGGGGSGNGEFSQISGLAVNTSGKSFYTDMNQDRVQRFTETGIYHIKWGSNGTGNSQFDSPREIVVDPFNGVWVADHNNCRLQKFTSVGVYIGEIGDGCGNGQFQFEEVTEIAYAKTYMFVYDKGNGLIQRWDAEGLHYNDWAIDAALGTITALAGNSSGDIFAAYSKTNTNTIVQYNIGGTLINSWVSTITSDAITCMDFDSGDNLHIGYSGNFIRIHEEDGSFIKQYGESGSGSGQILALDRLVFGPNDDLYIAGCAGNENCRISRFNKMN